MPTHNRPDYLKTALRSVLSQDWDSWECIVVDDGSDPHARLPFDDARLRLFRHESALGPAASRNSGVRHARGRYIGFLDDDDLIPPSRIRVAIEALDSNADANCHVGALVRSWNPEQVDASNPGPVPTEQALVARTPSVGQLTLRTELVKEFDPALRVGEDVDWWVRVEPNAVPVISESIVYVVRLHRTHRPGASDAARLDARLQAYRKNANATPRWSHVRARQQQRVASAALTAGRPGLAFKFAVSALLNRPTARRFKLAGLSILAGLQRATSRWRHNC